MHGRLAASCGHLTPDLSTYTALTKSNSTHLHCIGDSDTSTPGASVPRITSYPMPAAFLAVFLFLVAPFCSHTLRIRSSAPVASFLSFISRVQSRSSLGLASPTTI